MPACPITMPQALKAAQMYEQGYSMLGIERELGLSRKSIKTAFRQLGVKPRSMSELLSGRKLSPAHRERISAGLRCFHARQSAESPIQ